MGDTNSKHGSVVKKDIQSTRINVRNYYRNVSILQLTLSDKKNFLIKVALSFSNIVN